MKDFDAERAARNRLRKAPQFKLGGQVFTMRMKVRPDLIAAAEEIGEEDSAKQTLVTIDEVILGFIDPKGKAHDTYRQLREDDRDPITLQDMLELMKWLVEEYTARPTQPPKRSSAGRKRTGTSSTAASRSSRGRK